MCTVGPQFEPAPTHHEINPLRQALQAILVADATLGYDGAMLLTAPVECGKYFKADRGTLTLEGGQLKFEAGGLVRFDVALSSIQRIVWHWYSLSGAFEATIAGQSYFLSFVPRRASLSDWYTGLSDRKSVV